MSNSSVGNNFWISLTVLRLPQHLMHAESRSCNTTKYVDSFLSNLFLHYFCFCSFLIIKKESMDSVQNLSIKIKKCPWTQFSRLLLIKRALLDVVYLILFLHYFCFCSKRCLWTPSMTGGAWTRPMKVVHGPAPKWGSMDPWSIIT